MAPQPNTAGYAAFDESGVLKPWNFPRRDVGPNDVEIEIHYCGICHSDLHQLKNEWKGTTYPVVPGHEITGIVSAVGSSVRNFQEGEHVGVGCMVDSCRSCERCQEHLENYCQKCVMSYNSPHPEDKTTPVTYGGYSNRIICSQDFVLRIPANLPLADAAPLLCAGITVYSPIMHYQLNKPGSTLGVLGLGGLGHMAVKIGKAMGLKVAVISTSTKKQEEAIENLGADMFICSKDPEAMKTAAASLDNIIDTVSAHHSLTQYLDLLKWGGKIILVGASPSELPVMPAKLLFGRKAIGGSLIGGIKETQEMLDFCGKHNVLPLIEKVPVDYINTALERMEKNDVRYRFVLDIKNHLKADNLGV